MAQHLPLVMSLFPPILHSDTPRHVYIQVQVIEFNIEEHFVRPPGFKTICCVCRVNIWDPLQILHSEYTATSGKFERPDGVDLTKLSSILRDGPRQTMTD